MEVVIIFYRDLLCSLPKGQDKYDMVASAERLITPNAVFPGGWWMVEKQSPGCSSAYPPPTPHLPFPTAGFRVRRTQMTSPALLESLSLKPGVG